MKTIVLNNGKFGKEAAIRLEFPFDFELKELVKTYPGSRWVPYTKDQLDALLRFLKEKQRWISRNFKR